MDKVYEIMRNKGYIVGLLQTLIDRLERMTLHDYLKRLFDFIQLPITFLNDCIHVTNILSEKYL